MITEKERSELINCKALRELAIQNIKKYCILTGESEDTIKSQLFIWADEFNIKSPQDVYSEFYELSCKLNHNHLNKLNMKRSASVGMFYLYTFLTIIGIIVLIENF